MFLIYLLYPAGITSLCLCYLLQVLPACFLLYPAGITGLFFVISCRYYQRFRDAYRQAAIDLTLGQPVSDDLLAKPGETAEDEGGDDTPDGEEQLEGEENLRQLIEDCKRMLIVEPEQCLGGWGVINADTVSVSLAVILALFLSVFLSHYPSLLFASFSFSPIFPSLSLVLFLFSFSDPPRRTFTYMSSFPSSSSDPTHFCFVSLPPLGHVNWCLGQAFLKALPVAVTSIAAN